MIELMVAMAIIAILAAVTLPRLMTARYRAYLSACLVNERNIATALETYRNDNRIYPATTLILVGGDISKLPLCPSVPTTAYQYVVAPDGSTYTLYCAGYHHYQLNGHLPNFPQYSAESGLKE